MLKRSMPDTHRSSVIHRTMPISSVTEFSCTLSPRARAGLEIQGGDQRGLQPIAPTLVASSKYSEVA